MAEIRTRADAADSTIPVQGTSATDSRSARPKLHQRRSPGSARSPLSLSPGQWRSEAKDGTQSLHAATDELDSVERADEKRVRHRPHRFMTSCRLRRAAVAVVLFGLLAWFVWQQSAGSRLAELLTMQAESAPLVAGTTSRDGSAGFVTRVQTLDPRLLPGGEADPEGQRRLVFIGDVHGCKEELLHLLKKIKYRDDLDHLILTGDVVSKGPDNIGTLDELIRLGATSVRGNHEDRLLKVAKAREAGNDAVLAAGKRTAKNEEIVRHLKERHLDYLHSLPLILRVPALPMASKSTNKKKSTIAEEILVVHGGLVPAVPLEKQDEYMIMNMRSINRKTNAPSDDHAEKADATKPWVEVWDWYNDKLYRGRPPKDLAPQTESQVCTPGPFSWLQRHTWFAGTEKSRTWTPQVVVFGHDSKMGLQIHRWAKGLDSACVSGGELTALVLDARGHHELVSVACRNYRD